MSDPFVIERTDSRLRTSDHYVARLSRGRESGLILVEVRTPFGETIATGLSNPADAIAWAEREIEIQRQKDKGIR